MFIMPQSFSLLVHITPSTFLKRVKYSYKQMELTLKKMIINRMQYLVQIKNKVIIETGKIDQIDF